MKTKILRLVLLFIFYFSLSPFRADAQTETHNFITYDTLIPAPYAGISWRLRISRPANMFVPNDPDTASRPALITIPGQGEMGTNYGQLQAYGPHYWVNHGWDGGIVLGNGTHYPILVTIISSNTYMTAQEANDVVDIVLNKFHIKKNSVHVAGLSQGAFALSGMILFEQTAGAETGMKKITSLVCLEGASEELPFPYSSWSMGPAGWGHWAKKYGGKFFGLEGITDFRVVSRVSRPMNDSMPGSGYFSYENIGGGAHCCWNSMYNPGATNWRSLAPMGPNNVTGADPNTMGTYYLGENIFTWMFRQGDTTMVGAPVTTPTVNAGVDQALLLPVSLITLSGNATPAAGSGSTITGYTWTKESGPACLIVTPNSNSTIVTGIGSGTFTFRLTATASNGTSSYDDVVVTTNNPPVANAGPDKNIQLPTNTVQLVGGGTDSDGTISSTGYQWTKISGPTCTIQSPTASTTNINALNTAGTYQFRFRVTDNGGATAFDTVNVIVAAAANVLPTANAGGDQSITLPTDFVSLNGSGSDADGSVSSHTWTKITTPAATITDPTSYTSTVTGMAQGTHRFVLSVTDNAGATTTDTVVITVNAANVPPSVSAGSSSSSIQLPTNNVMLNGTGNDADGAVSTHAWSKITTPPANITAPGAYTTSVTGMGQGTHKFVLSVTDNAGATTTDTVTVSVMAANVLPVANAGSPQTIQLPIDNVTLSGSGSDADGTISSHTWTKITTPAANITDATSYTTTVAGMAAGTHRFVLTVTDNSGETSTDTVTITVNAANIPPVANAGAPITIQLPTNSITLNGSGTDADGTIALTSWTKISGGVATITTPSSDTTTVTGLAVGTYEFELTVTDNQGATGKDTVLVTVNAPANIPPVANAGAPQTIQLPTNTVTLNGSGTDADGTVSTYSWTKINGGAATITSASSDTTTVTGLAQGTYQFELTVTDNLGATGKDTVTITVSAANNVAPTANAGSDITIQLPANSVTLNGSGNDADGTIASFAWVKISGGAATITSPSSDTTTVTGLAVGTYQFELIVTDNAGDTGRDTVVVTVNAAANIPPVANAGNNQTIQLPTNSVTLNGSGTDTDGTIALYSWTKISGGAATINSPSSDTTLVTGLAVGVYQFELTVTDNTGATDKDTVTITVNAAANIPPVANAGTDHAITLPASSTSLNGSGTDADGTIASYAWTKISGGAATITSPTSDTTTVTGLAAGIYEFELTVTDNSGATDKDTVVITVNTAANIPPVANAGADHAITLPVNSTSLNGSGTDADGTIASYAWTKISGGAATITSPTSDTTTVTGLVAGVYEFELTVTDNSGATDKDTVVITVNAAANIPPVANAGVDQTITLPVNIILLNGSGTDADGTIASYAWTKLSGGAAVIISPASDSTTITGLVAGTYQFLLTVTDNAGATGVDTVTITVNAANIPPIANAGTPQAITLPTNSITLNGSGTDADGIIASYSWVKLPGGPANIVSPTSATTSVTGLTAGTYYFLLIVTDNQGAAGTDTVTITVNPNPVPPSNVKLVRKVAITEYKVGYLATDSNFYSFTNQIMQPYNLGGRKVVDVSAGFNELIMLDDQGYVWKHIPNSTNPVRWNTDTTGAPFNNNIAIFGYYPNYTSIRTDSSLWYWGEEQYNFFPGTSFITRPIQLSPAGMKVKKVVMGYYRIVVLTTNGQVWEFLRGNPTPVQKVIPRPAIDIFGSHWDYGGCIIPDVTGQTMGYPFVWGSSYGYWGGNAPYSQPTSVKALWNVTAPIKDIATSYSTTHYIDSLGRMYGIGDNPQGEIGNGQELVNHAEIYSYPYGWSWNNDEMLTHAPAIQIGQGKTWKKVFAGNTLSFYKYALDENDSLYSWGRNKALALGNGYIAWQEATYPNWGDVLVPTMVSPLTAIQQYYNFTKYTINAGADQNITGATATLTGTGTPSQVNAAGAVNNGQPNIGYSLVSYQWRQLVGPAGATISTPTQASTTVTGLTTGTYKFQLLITDNNTGTFADTVLIAVNGGGPNQAPVANAGNNQIMTLPQNSITLNGSGVDADGNIASYLWTKISGPAQYNIVSPTQPVTIINNLVQGVYQFELRVTDNLGAIGRDTVQITVNGAAPNIPPVANAGPDRTITLPTSSLTVTGSGTDADGTISGYLWTKISGPAAGTIVSPTQSQTLINNLSQGVYRFELRVTDNAGATARDTMQVTVNSPTIPPVANAGPNQIIVLPTSTVTLNGSGTDADGSVVGYLWTKIFGPAQYTIVTPNQATTIINNLTVGTYQFQLTVTDNLGATGLDTVTITVNATAPPANLPPAADAGNDQTITLPTNTVTLNGVGVDADGTVVGYQWTKISGPATGTIASPTQAQTVVNNMVQGVYQFELIVTDNLGATGKDTVTVTVNAAPNVPPVAFAGTDQTITLPTNTVTLNGNGTDADGTIASYSWIKLSGGAASITNPTSATTTITGLVQGVYQFQLTVTDNSGATATDVVTIVVNAAAPVNNISPIANAGLDKSLILPQDSTTLQGSGIDPDGSIVSYHWSQIGGPGGAIFGTPNNPQTQITNLSEGIYYMQFEVTDNRGAKSADTMSIIVRNLAISRVAVYPNPADDVINVLIDAKTQANQTTITVIDALGRPMIRETFMRTQNVMVKQVDISKLDGGVYFVQVTADINNTITTKIIKRKK